MGSWIQFAKFDPTSGYVPAHPFHILPTIARRARILLTSRTAGQIRSAAEGIAWAIDEYFRNARETEIARLRDALDERRNWGQMSLGDKYYYNHAQKFFEWDGGSRANGHWIFNDAMEGQLEIPTTENTGEVDALKECIELWDDIGGEYFADAKPYEAFAVLSLWMLGDAIEWLQHKDDGGLDEPVAAILKELGIGASLAGEYALKAMDAVCHAEHLHEMARLKEEHALDLSKTHESYLVKAVKKIASEGKRRSIIAEQLNVKRHCKTREAKAKAIEEWNRSRSKWPSAEKAGNELAKWVVTQGIVESIEPRTVTNWIREYAKQIGVRLR